MDTRRYVLKQTALIALGQVLCGAVVCGIFALLRRLDQTVILGSAVGAAVAVLNFFFMAIGAMIASDKAVAQDVKGGKATVKASVTLRLVFSAVVLFAFAKSGLCNVLTLVLPLAFNRPILTLLDFFGKAGEKVK